MLAGQQGAAHPFPLQVQHDDHVHIPHPPPAQFVADPGAPLHRAVAVQGGLDIGVCGEGPGPAHTGDGLRLANRRRVLRPSRAATPMPITSDSTQSSGVKNSVATSSVTMP